MKNGKIRIAQKKVGETPLQVIQRVRIECPEYKDEKITYAGRLDPMAEGVLLLLIGEEVHKKDEYLKLEKEYTFDILFGFSTDTYDILGKAEKGVEIEIKKSELSEVLLAFKGEQEQFYPPFSSKPVNGKPLFQWARDGKLSEIELPSHKISIDSIDLLDFNDISSDELFKYIKEKIASVGDFFFYFRT